MAGSEGYIKFRCHWLWAEADHAWPLGEINAWRSRLRSAGLLGQDSQGIGFGNVSVRLGANNQFVITGTQTGGHETLEWDHLTRVLAFTLEKNELTCQGPIRASSESMTHAVFYQLEPLCQAVVHVHQPVLWKTKLNLWPATHPDAAFGTPELAWEMERLFKAGNLHFGSPIVMGGHCNGLLAYGRNLEEACGRLLQESSQVI